MKTIRLRRWIPLLLGALLFVLFGATALLVHESAKRQLLESSQQSLTFDMAALSQELERAIRQEQMDMVSRLLSSRNVNTRYRALFIYDRVKNDVVASSEHTPAFAEYYRLNKRDIDQLDALLVNTSSRVTYDSHAHQFNAYNSIPWPNELEYEGRTGVLIARYSIDEAYNLLQSSVLQLITGLSVAFFATLVVTFWWQYRFLTSPKKIVLETIAALARSPWGSFIRLKGQGEFAVIQRAILEQADSLVQMEHQNLEVSSELRAHRSVMESVFTVIPDLFFLTDDELRILEYRAPTGLLYATPEEFVGKKMTEILPDDVAQKFVNAKTRLIETGELITIEYELSVPDGFRSFEARMAIMPDKSNGIIVLARDISQRRYNETLIHHQAYYDGLTDLPNRQLALDRLAQSIREAVRQGDRVAVFFLDLDDFKNINDSLGHDVGDKVLKMAGERLTSLMRGSDTVARLGGDEFVVLMPSVSEISDITRVAANILDVLVRPFSVDGRDLVMGCSVGIAVYPDDGTSSGELLRKADTAMYHAKHKGKHQYSFFTEDMNRQIERRLQVEDKMSQALQNDEFSVYLQPQYDLKQARLIGAEALLRWKNPELGFVSPAEFIPIAEQNGKIIQIGHYVIREATAHCAELMKVYGEHFRVAINLSPRQMRDPDLRNVTLSSLRESGLAGKNIEIEITEGVLLSGKGNVLYLLESFRKEGIHLSMDDFGTGYSSLSYLQKYPFDLVKIDRSFIHGMEGSEQNLALVRAIIRLAHSLKLKVIAEGVETESQARILMELDCDMIQGYFLGKPVALEQFKSAWLEAEKQLAAITDVDYFGA